MLYFVVFACWLFIRPRIQRNLQYFYFNISMVICGHLIFLTSYEQVKVSTGVSWTKRLIGVLVRRGSGGRKSSATNIE